MGDEVKSGAAGGSGVGGASESPAALGGDTEPAYTAAQIGEMLVPKRGKRIILEWAVMQPTPCPVAGERRGKGGPAKVFRLSEVKAWARLQGLAVDEPVEAGGMFAAGAGQDQSSKSKVQSSNPEKREAVVLTDFGSIRTHLLAQLGELVSSAPPAESAPLVKLQHAQAVGKLSQELRSIAGVLADLEDRDTRVMTRAAAGQVLSEIAETIMTLDTSLAAMAAEGVRLAIVAARPDPADAAQFNNIVAAALREAVEGRRARIAEVIAQKAEQLEQGGGAGVGGGERTGTGAGGAGVGGVGVAGGVAA